MDQGGKEARTEAEPGAVIPSSMGCSADLFLVTGMFSTFPTRDQGRAARVRTRPKWRCRHVYALGSCEELLRCEDRNGSAMSPVHGVSLR